MRTEGASAINCLCPVANPPTCLSLGRHSSVIVLSPTRPTTVKKPSCLNPECPLHGNARSSHIIRYGFYRTTAGTAPLPVRGMRPDVLDDEGTPYYRLQHRRTTFDTVVTLSVEVVSRSAIARTRSTALGTPPNGFPSGSRSWQCWCSPRRLPCVFVGGGRPMCARPDWSLGTRRSRSVLPAWSTT